VTEASLLPVLDKVKWKAGKLNYHLTVYFLCNIPTKIIKISWCVSKLWQANGVTFSGTQSIN